MRKLENIIKERRLDSWDMSYEWRTPEYLTMFSLVVLASLYPFNSHCVTWHVTQWELKGYKRKPGRPRINWTDIVKRNLKNMDITWEEAKELAADRTEWRQQDAG